MLVLVVVGLLCLVTPYLPVGVALIAAGVWFYERGPADDDALMRVLMVLGGLGAAGAFAAFLLGGEFRLPDGY